MLIVLFGVTAFTTAETARQAAPARVIWRGINTDVTTGPICQGQLVQTFEFVGEEVPDRDPRWLSRKVTWNYSESCKADVLVLEDTGGATPQRVLRPWSGSCVNTGEADLNLVPDPERKGQCQESPNLGNMSNHHYPTLGWTGPRPPEEMRNGCAYHRRSRSVGSDGTVRLITYSVTVSRGQPDAVVDVDRETYGRFVPEPGNTFTVTARSASGPVRFRFELDPTATSRFPGYATNANVDGEFFTTYNLTRLRDQYTNGGPDFVFYPSNFAETEWARIEPAVIESAAPQTSVAVTVTAMDYGAIGSLRAFVQSDDCEGAGGWQPVPVRVGGDTRDSLSLPLDADDNLIADALEPYRGIASGTDGDAEPKGNGMAGDGLTAFEEYRGFLVSSGACPRSAGALHVRTNPIVKDLFVHTPDPELEMALPHFAWSSGLDVHAICETQYAGNPVIDWTGAAHGDLGTRAADRSRVVNLTLQSARIRAWRGHAVSQEVPQHGLYLIARTLNGPSGVACSNDPPSCSDEDLGPPMLTSVVIVDKDALMALTRPRLALMATTTHELGHAVGLPHHAWKVENWKAVTVRRNIGGDPDAPPVVPPGPDCVDPRDQPAEATIGMYFKGEFIGCGTNEIIVRHGQNSGHAECPMRYSFGDSFREAPGSPPASYVPAKADAVWLSDGGLRPTTRGGRPRDIRLYQGRYLKYDNSLDHEAAGQFCLVKTGTGLNSVHGANHAGDSQVACRDQLVINDNVLRGIR
jgi:hypothetical protein